MNNIDLLMTRLRESRIDEEEGYTVNKVNESKFTITKDGGEEYILEKKQSRWVCSCIGFKYRHTCKHLDMIKEYLPKRHERSTITKAIKDIMPQLKKITPKVEVVGSYRRGSKDSKDIDILMDCSSSDFKKVVKVLESYENYTPVMAGDSIIRGFCDGIEMDINRLTEGMNYYLALEYRTGPMEHNVAMRSLAKKLYGSLSENELVVYGHNMKVSSEKDIYDALGVEYQEPEKRSRELKYLKTINTSNDYRAWKGTKDIGAAPSRSFAKGQVKQIKDLVKILAKEIKLPSEWRGRNIDVRFTAPDKELVKVTTNFVVKSPQGDEIPCNQYIVEITPIVKLDGKRLSLGEFINMGNGMPEMLYDVIANQLQNMINKKMKLPTTGVGKMCSVELDLGNSPLTMRFRTVPFSVDNVR